METDPLLRPPSNTQASEPTAVKSLATKHAFAILITLTIGSGIFASPSQVDGNVPSPGAALVVWALGGLLSWTGAVSFAELGAAIPLNGGMQEYLRYVYGDTAAFMMAWIYIMAAKPSAMAISSIVIASSLGLVVANSSTAWTPQLVASLAFVFLVFLNSISTTVTLKLSESFTRLKLLTVSGVALGGLAVVIAGFAGSSIFPSASDDWHTRNWFASRNITFNGDTMVWSSLSTWDKFGRYAAAMYGALWAFDGWDNANIVASEIQDPTSMLPWAIRASMIVVLSSYELVNVAYYIMLPWESISSSSAIAVLAMRRVFGHWAGIITSILVAISCAGAITGNIFVVGRLIVAASHRRYLPELFSRRGVTGTLERKPVPTAISVLHGSSHAQTMSPAIGAMSPTLSDLDLRWGLDAPLPANILLMFITLIYISWGSFPTLLTFVGMATWIFYVSTVLGVVILRRREPELPRPYKANLVLPLIFVCVGSVLLVRSAIYAPVQSGILLGLLLMGAIFNLVHKFHRSS